MHYLFITDPLSSFKIYKDSSYAMMRSAIVRGHQISVCLQSDILYQDNIVYAQASPLNWQTPTEDTPLPQTNNNWYTLGESSLQALAQFDAVLMRKDPPFDLEYLYTTHLLERSVAQGARVFNAPSALRNHGEKLSIMEFSSLIPPTLISCRAEPLRAFVQQYKRTIFKPLDGMGGMGIFRVDQGDLNLSVIIETMTENETRTIMAQEYLPSIEKGDKRILLIDGVAVPWCLARIPAVGESRGNLAAGGAGVVQTLSPRDWEIAKQIGPTLAKRGLLLVGLDVIGNHLTEINITSPTCLQEISRGSNFDVAEHFISTLEKHSTR